MVRKIIAMIFIVGLFGGLSLLLCLMIPKPNMFGYFGPVWLLIIGIFLLLTAMGMLVWILLRWK